ncbi:MAG TPA: 23S rRNA (guanosine(2251)-2'-O)-methyltransferase RlmB [Halanaerobiales bacterium]|nr:23S rRNA (guanosine(2251)-2'-O)-methyltransferase RlmB [Halanaerobiales bacterium]
MANVEGRNPVNELLKGNRKVKEILLQRDIRGEIINKIKEKSKKNNILIREVSKKHLDNIAESYSHQGVIAKAEEITLVSPEDIVEYAQNQNEPPFIIILDQVQDPHNFGSIIRSAHSAGAHGLIFQKRRAASITPAVLKASAGASEHLLLSQVTNINYTIEKLKELGVWITGTDLDTEKYYDDVDYKGSTAVVIGNEGSGLRRLVKDNCDFLVKIPIKGRVDSLNASVAAGVIFYEVVRQRK